MNVRQATIDSVNAIFAQLDLDVGPENVKQMAEKLGITTPARRHPRRGNRRPAASESHRSSMPTPTRRSPTAASTTPRPRSRKVVFPNGKADIPERDSEAPG